MPNVMSLWDNSGDTYTGAIEPLRNSVLQTINRSLRKSKLSNRKSRELLLTLLGAAAGSTATDTYARPKSEVNTVNGVFGALGGERTIETITPVNRVTTSQDITDLTALLDQTRQLGYLSVYGDVNVLGRAGSFA